MEDRNYRGDVRGGDLNTFSHHHVGNWSCDCEELMKDHLVIVRFP